ncbi:MAG: PHP domain-containing protein, partial [Acidobacteriota bacterium]
MRYCELHAGSAFSFLRGGILPESLATAAAEKNIPAIAQLDRDNLSGAVRFHKASRSGGVKPIVGAEVTMFDGASLPLIPVNRRGYQNLCRLLTDIKLREQKGEHRATFEDLEMYSSDIICLSGGHEDGLVPRSVRSGSHVRTVDRLRTIFDDRFFIEVQRHLRRDEEQVNGVLFALADSHRIPVVATNGPIFSEHKEREIADVFSCLRNHRNIRTAGRMLSLNAERSVKSSAQMMKLFADREDAVKRTSEVADMISFSIDDVGYRFPDYDTPDGGPMGPYLRHLTFEGAARRYSGKVPEKIAMQLRRELDLIEKGARHVPWHGDAPRSPGGTPAGAPGAPTV